MEFTTIALMLMTLTLIPAETGKIVKDALDNFIIDVKPDCGKSMQANNLKIEVVTDAYVTAHALCANGEVGFITTDDVKHTLQGSLLPKGSLCLFNRRGATNVYTVIVNVAFGKTGVHRNLLKYLITCTYDLNGEKTSVKHSLVKGVLAPTEVRVDIGKNVTSDLALNVFDVADSKVTKLRSGKKVYLSATSDGKNKEVGIRPVSCYAIGKTSNEKFAFLRAGCGAGLMFNHTQGFTTKGLTSTSPYFKIFQIMDDHFVSFECVFVLCNKNCDGSSCGKNREKRSALSGSEERIILRTTALSFGSDLPPIN